MGLASTILQDLGVSEEGAIHEYALLTASQKLAEFTQECSVFQKKYQMNFDDFERKLRSSQTEVFAEDEDYFAWKFAQEGATYWREKIELLKREQSMLFTGKIRIKT